MPKSIILSSQTLTPSKLMATFLKKTKRDNVNITKFIYRSNNHKVIGYHATPKKVRGKLPCVIWNRGGNRDYSMWTDDEVFVKLGAFARWGYIAITTQYSGNDGGEGRDEFGGADLADVLNLKKVLEELPHADTSRIGMGGASRGGLMTYRALAKVRWITAAVAVAAPADLRRTVKLRPEMRAVFNATFGGSPAELKKRSAIFWANKFSKNVPLLILHGTADSRVSPLDSLCLSQKLLEHKIHHRLVLFEKGDHGLTNFATERVHMTREWFDQFLSLKM